MKISDSLFKVCNHILNNNTLYKLRCIRDIFYSKWISNEFESAKNVTFRKPIMVIGGKSIEIGLNTKICKYTVLSTWGGDDNHTKLKIGGKCNIGEYNHITAANSISIGNGVLTGRWVTITDNSHGRILESEMDIEPQKRDVYSKGPVIIGNNVWLGDKVTVCPGVHIGDGCVIGANAVITKDIPPYCVACGNPAKVVKIIKDNNTNERV